MCVECFQNSPCINHNFRLVKSGGGSCDCGDPEAWKASSFCKRHSVAASHAGGGGSVGGVGGEDEEGAQVAAAVKEAQAVFDEILLLIRTAISAPWGADDSEEEEEEEEAAAAAAGGSDLPAAYANARPSECAVLVAWLARKAAQHRCPWRQLTTPAS